MRALRNLLIVVVILAAVFVAADRVALHFAEEKAADHIRSSEGLDKTPDVSIKGFPFLTQLAGHSLDEVDAKIGPLTTGQSGHTLRVQRLTARFHDVKLSSDYTSVQSAGSATAGAHLTYADLSTAAGNGAKISYGGEKNGRTRVRITPNIPLIGSNLTITGTVTVKGHTVRLRADNIPTLCRTIPGCEAKVRARTDYTWTVGALPDNLSLDSVKASSGGVDVTASGHDVHL